MTARERIREIIGEHWIDFPPLDCRDKLADAILAILPSLVDEEKVFELAHQKIMDNADEKAMIWFGDTAKDIAHAIATGDIFK